MKNRLTICVFWDKEGVLREYALFYIKALKEFSEKLLVVVNGVITEASQKTLEELGCKVVKRENRALDFGAYKFGLSYVGFEKLDEFEEIILTNTTCYGPVFPFSEMFDEMDKRDCDFWGITEHASYDDKLWLKKHVYAHLQSYFLVFRKNVFSSKEFYEFFKAVKHEEALAYKQIINLYETELTHYFESKGFRSSCYIDCKSYFDEKNLNPCYLSTLELIKEERLPLVKRKAIVFDPDLSIKRYHGNKCLDLMNYLKEETGFDTNMIMTDLIRDYPLSKLKFAFHLNYVLPEEYLYSSKKGKLVDNELENNRIALVIYVSSLKHIELILDKASNMPEKSSLFIVLNSKENVDLLKTVISKSSNFQNYNIEYRLGNENTDIYEAYYVICKDVYDNFDFVCCIQSFDEMFLNSDKNYIDFYLDNLKSLLSSKEYVENLITKFNENPYVGLITSNLPLTGSYDDIMWGREIYQIDTPDVVSNLRKHYKLNVPLDNGNLASYCGIFIVRSKSLKVLLDNPFDFNSLRSYGITLDYVIRSAMDFVLPQLVQESGYLTASALPVSEASRYYDCMFYNNRVTEYAPCPTLHHFKDVIYEKAYIKRINLSEFFKYFLTVRKTPDNKYKYLTIFGFNFLLKEVGKKRN